MTKGTKTKKQIEVLSSSISKLAARQWGTLTTRDIDLARQLKISMLHEALPPRASAPDVVHSKTKELVFILKGVVTAFLNGRKFIYKKGDCFLIPAGMKHRFETMDKHVEALSLFVPPLNYKKFDAKIVYRRKA